jgi:glycosyltransferase involved in cell wall biosynthesis
LPYVLLEAGFAEIPVISTNVGGISELVGDNKDKLVQSKNSKALLDALNDKKTFIPKHLTLDSMLTKTMELYR